jgi:hypothetical protein
VTDDGPGEHPSGPPLEFGQLAGPIHLPSLTPAERLHAMEQLREWVAALVIRFHIDSRVIPPCWEQHNGMVEALAALRDHERDCYAETAPPSAAVDWFRAIREIEGRLIEIAALTNCTAREHRAPPPGWVSAPQPAAERASRPAGGAPSSDVT